MGKRKHLDKIEELFKKSNVVSFDAIERITKGYSKTLINNLLNKKKIQRLTKGYYTTRNEAALAVHCFKPSYLGLQSALSFHNLWEQETIPIIITSNKIRQGIRKVMETNILIRRIDKKHNFGFEYYNDSGFALPYSDIEKTLIDMIVFKEKINDQTLAEIKKKLDIKKLEKYLEKYPKKIRKEIRNRIR